MAIVERCRALGWAPSADEPNIPDVDSEWVEEGESLETYLAQAKEFVRLYYDGYPGVIEIYISGSPRTTVGRAGVEVDVATLAATLSTIPFEVAIFGDLYVTGPEPTPFGGYYPPRVESGLPLGWAIAFRGKGHDWLVSKRWLASGPWKWWHGPDDIDVIQFQALDVNASVALTQIRPGHDLFGGIDRGGCIRSYDRYDKAPLTGALDEATKTMRVKVGDRAISDRELLEWAVARIRGREGLPRFEHVAFVFAREDVARAQLPRLWKYEHQCWVTRNGEAVRLDLDYKPPDLTPGWARGEPAFDFSQIELGKVLRSGTGSEVREGTSRLDGTPLLVTLTGPHPDDPSEPVHNERYQLPIDPIATLAWIGRVANQRFTDVLVERPAGRPATELAPFDDRGVAALGAPLAAVVARVHYANALIDGIQPELIYVDDGGHLTGLAPRGPRFVASAPAPAGPSCYPIPYVGHEALILGKPAAQATDVFALCASLFVLRTGKHPFGDLDSLPEIMMRIMANQPEPWPTPGALADLIARGLAQDPKQRPTATELVRAFAALE